MVSVDRWSLYKGALVQLKWTMSQPTVVSADRWSLLQVYCITCLIIIIIIIMTYSAQLLDHLTIVPLLLIGTVSFYMNIRTQ